MNITILCSSEEHPVNVMLTVWADRQREYGHSVDVVRKKSELMEGELLFLISCSEIINSNDRKRYSKVLVIHASDLPLGRGWSPHIWAILNGSEEITVSLLEAEDKVDTGDIWKKISIAIDKNALHDEINSKIFDSEEYLMDFAVENFDTISPIKQSEKVEPSYYPKRTPDDSRIDPGKSITEQFDQIRVCDPERFPAFFYHLGNKYTLQLKKVHDE